MLILLIVTTVTVTAQTSIERGDEAFRLHDYETAIMLYEEAIATGHSTGTIFYNLGSAYYAIDDSGKAMLNYRRAEIYMPRDVELSVSIARIRAQRTTITTDDTNSLHLLATLTNDTMTQFELSIIVFVLWVVFFVMLIIGLLRKTQDSNYQMVVGVMGVILLAGLILLGSRVYVETWRPDAVILSDTATVMSGPGEDYLSIYSVHTAAEVRILEQVDEWVRFALPDGRGGWILRQDVGFVNEPIK